MYINHICIFCAAANSIKTLNKSRFCVLKIKDSIECVSIVLYWNNPAGISSFKFFPSEQ
jgi:hypothetical protein